MATLIPESLTRLQATAFVRDSEMSAKEHGEIVYTTARKLAENGIQKLLSDCIKIEALNYPGKRLSLDVYVLSQSELESMLVKARSEGARDALRWDADGIN